MIERTSQLVILKKHLMQREAFSSGKHSLFEKVQLCALRAVSRKKDRLFTAFLFLRCAPINALVLVQNYHGAASLTNQTLRKFVSRCAFKVSTQFSACFSILASLSSLLKPITTVSSLVVICMVKRGMLRFRQMMNCIWRRHCEVGERLISTSPILLLVIWFDPAYCQKSKSAYLKLKKNFSWEFFCFITNLAFTAKTAFLFIFLNQFLHLNFKFLERVFKS